MRRSKHFFRYITSNIFAMAVLGDLCRRIVLILKDISIGIMLKDVDLPFASELNFGLCK